MYTNWIIEEKYNQFHDQWIYRFNDNLKWITLEEKKCHNNTAVLFHYEYTLNYF